MKFVLLFLFVFVSAVRGATTFLGSDTTFPYSIPLNTTNMANGTYTFYARAFDPAGNQGFSVTNTVIVDNQAVTNSATWAQRFGSTGSDLGRAVAVDSSGNIYIGASFSVATSFGGLVLTNAGGNDLAFAKYATNGTHVWSVRQGFTGGETPTTIAVSPGGKLFAGGSFIGTANFGGTNCVGSGNVDGWIGCYSATDGSFNWSRAFGSTAVDTVYSVAADSSDNVFVCGTFQNTVNLGGTNLSSVSGATDLFIAKYNSSGVHQWSQSFPNDGDDFAKGITVDSSANCYVAGYFTSFINFGGGNLVSSDVIFGGPEMFLAKFNSSGAYVWANKYGSNKTERALAIALDPGGKLAIVGNFYPYTDVGGGAMTIPAGSVQQDIFNGKYTTASGVFQWAKQGTGNFLKNPTAIACDSSGNVVSVGAFASQLSFGTSSVTAVGRDDIYAVKYSSSAGAVTWVRSFGGIQTDTPYGVAIDSLGYIVMTGAFDGVCNFNGTILTPAGAQDAFLLRMSP